MNKGEQYVQTLNELETQRDQLVPIWRDCFDLTAPERGEGFWRARVDYQVDTSKRAELYDSAGADSVNLFASALMSGLTPSNSKWFQFGLASVDNERLSGIARNWLQDASEVMFDAIHSSNYDAVALEFLKDVAIAGMAGLYVDMDEDGNLVFEEWALDNLFVLESKRNGGIDTVYRRLQLTPAQAYNLFGEDTPDSTIEQYKTGKRLSDLDEYIHCIHPVKGKAVTAEAKLAKNMPFRSVYVHSKTGKVVREGGFNEMPVIIPRWAVIPNTPYATGPLYAALPDLKSLNELKRQFLTNAELVISPPLVADDDGVINPNNIKLGPRQIMFKSSQGDIRPLFTVGNLDWAMGMIQQLQESIRRQMLADQLAPAVKSYMTAQEIMQRQDTIRGLLGPLFGRLESELLRPLLTRVFGLLYRANRFEEVPDELLGIDFKPNFTGPHARAQRMERANVMMNYVATLSNLAQIDQSVLDTFDFTAAAARYAHLTGVEADLLRDRREIEAMQQQRSQAAQQAQMAQVMTESMGDAGGI